MKNARAVANVLGAGLIMMALTLAGKAQAAADLQLSLSGPNQAMVYTAHTYTATVRNIGNKTANAAVLRISFPQTATSPQVYILGELSAVDSRCQLSNRVLVCNLGAIVRNATLNLSFNFKFPQTTRALSLSASLSTSSSENSTANNGASIAPSVEHPALEILTDAIVTNSHCTGTALTSYFECLKFPSSISQHAVNFHQDGSITLDGAPEFSGQWSQEPSTKNLSFTYFDNGEAVATFTGWAVNDRCFEGITEFYPASTYNSAYRVCLP